MVESICMCENCGAITVFEGLKCSNCEHRIFLKSYAENKFSVKELINCGPITIGYNKFRYFRNYFNTLKEKGVIIKVE